MTVKDQYQWAPAVEGIFMDIRMIKASNSMVVVYVASKELRVGDSLGTAHGLKVTVREMNPVQRDEFSMRVPLDVSELNNADLDGDEAYIYETKLVDATNELRAARTGY